MTTSALPDHFSWALGFLAAAGKSGPDAERAAAMIAHIIEAQEVGHRLGADGRPIAGWLHAAAALDTVLQAFGDAALITRHAEIRAQFERDVGTKD